MTPMTFSPLPNPTWEDRVNAAATVAARNHPAGHENIYAEAKHGIQIAMCHPAGEQRNRAFESLLATMAQRQAEADAEIGRRRLAYEAMDAQRTLALRSGGVISRPARDSAVLEAIDLAKVRLDAAWPKLSNGSEDDFRAVLGDIETAVQALRSSVGVARRSSFARTRSEAATTAVAAAKAAVTAAPIPAEAA